MEIDKKEGEENSRKESTKEIICKEDLTPFFGRRDHSVNKVYFSEVNKTFTIKQKCMSI